MNISLLLPAGQIRGFGDLASAYSHLFELGIKSGDRYAIMTPSAVITASTIKHYDTHVGGRCICRITVNAYDKSKFTAVGTGASPKAARTQAQAWLWSRGYIHSSSHSIEETTAPVQAAKIQEPIRSPCFEGPTALLQLKAWAYDRRLLGCKIRVLVQGIWHDA